ncbi:MAG: nickel-dependent lactate racemase [Desulfobacteraceae bacterium]|nr:nickel-dependent lactate racemase [Desulfobacteraceae bacterium]
MTDLFIRYQGTRQSLELPPSWRLERFAAFEDRPQPVDPVGMTREALKSPVNHSPLAESVKAEDKIAIIIEDPSRSSPKQQVLRAVLDELAAAEIPASQIVIVIALGTHRQLSKQEMGEVYGKDLVEQYEFVNHDCKAPDLVPIGTLRSGTTVKLNPKVYEASFTIGIGSIFPHPMNGFGGGGKILFPAVANFDAILEHHLKYSFRGKSRIGNLEGNPFYEEVCDLAKAGGLNFIVNSVLDHNDYLYQVVCGEPIEAHQAGVAVSRKILSMEFPEKSDVTIISAFPYSEGTQIMKPLAPASEITRDGGLVILAADCSVPLPDSYLAGCENFRKTYGGRLREAVLEVFGSNRRIMEDGAPEFNMSMAQALLAQNDYKVILVSRDISKYTADRLGFFYAENLEQAIAMGQDTYPEARVHVVPSGGVILPVLSENNSV